MYLLKIEFKKLLPYSTFWALMGLSLASTFLLTYWSTDLTFKVNSAIHSMNTISWYQFPNIWENITWLCSYTSLFFISIITITIVCNEYVYKTIRQNVIDGLSRLELVMGKMSLIIALSLIMTIFTAIVCLLFGLSYSKGDINLSGMFNKSEYLAYFLLQAIAYGTVAYAIATLFKTTGISIIMFFVYKVIIESIIDWKFLPGNTGDYLPMNVFSALTPKPFEKVAETTLGMQAFSITHPVIEIIAISYILLITAGIYLLIMKRDL